MRVLPPKKRRYAAVPSLAPFETDFAPDAASVVADVGTSLTTVTGNVATADGAAYSATGDQAIAVGNIGKGTGLRISGSIAQIAGTGAESMQVWWGVDDALSQDGYIFSADGDSTYTLYKRTAGVIAEVDSYNDTVPTAGDLFVISHTSAGIITITINGANALSGDDTAYARNAKWGLVWSASSDGQFGVHSGRDNKFIVEAL
jgi:hypothetical protein